MTTRIGSSLSFLRNSRYTVHFTLSKAPAEVYATLLDEGTYHCSIRTMYRILQEADEVRERRNQLRHPNYKAPELLATAPNQVWSWDITKLKGAMKWTYFYLYVILDIFSRYVVGWMVAQGESSALAAQLIAETCQKQNIAKGQLTIHADRGSSMKSKPVALLMTNLGITKSHSRPYVSDDNPYSESQFKTLKYHPAFPERFGSIQDARSFCQKFFHWYNGEHRHGGIGLMTPENSKRRFIHTLGMERGRLARIINKLNTRAARFLVWIKRRLLKIFTMEWRIPFQTYAQMP